MCLNSLFVKHYFSLLNTFMGKGKDPEPNPEPYLWLMDPDPGGPKTCGSFSGSGSPTCLKCILTYCLITYKFFRFRLSSAISPRRQNPVPAWEAWAEWVAWEAWAAWAWCEEKCARAYQLDWAPSGPEFRCETLPTDSLLMHLLPAPSSAMRLMKRTHKSIFTWSQLFLRLPAQVNPQSLCGELWGQEQMHSGTISLFECLLCYCFCSLISFVTLFFVLWWSVEHVYKEKILCNKLKCRGREINLWIFRKRVRISGWAVILHVWSATGLPMLAAFYSPQMLVRFCASWPAWTG